MVITSSRPRIGSSGSKAPNFSLQQFKNHVTPSYDPLGGSSIPVSSSPPCMQVTCCCWRMFDRQLLFDFEQLDPLSCTHFSQRDNFFGIKWETLCIEQNNFWSRDETLNEESLFSPFRYHHVLSSGHCTPLFCAAFLGSPSCFPVHILASDLSPTSPHPSRSLWCHTPHFPPLLPQEIITTSLVKMGLYSNS